MLQATTKIVKPAVIQWVRMTTIPSVKPVRNGFTSAASTWPRSRSPKMNVCDSCLGNLQEEVQTSGTEEVEDGAARVSQDHVRGVSDEDNTTVLEDSSSQQVLNLLLERMDKLEIENSQLKNRICDLEKKLQSSTDSGPPRCPDTIVKGLQVVTAAKEVILKKLENSDKAAQKQTNELLEIKNDVARLKGSLIHRGPWEGWLLMGGRVSHGWKLYEGGVKKVGSVRKGA